MSYSEISWRTADGEKIFAQDWRPQGSVRGAVALVHGLGEHLGRYQHVADALNQAGYALTAFDLPDHGRSGSSRGSASFDSIMVEIDRLLQETRDRYPGVPYFLYGHSLGGMLVMYYTLKRQPPLNGIVVTSPLLEPATAVPQSTIFMGKILKRVAPAFRMKNRVDTTKLSSDPAVAQAYISDPLVRSYVHPRLGLDMLTTGDWIQANISRLSIPMLLSHGSEDKLVSVTAIEQLVKAVPAQMLTYKVWEGMLHEIHNELGKQQVFDFIIHWLGQHA